jgi:hypothetical protein
MKKALYVLAATAMAASAFAQGTIVFSSRTIDNAAGTGTYNVPIWGTDDNPNTKPTSGGAGDLAGGTTVGLFLASTPDNGAPVNNDQGQPAQTLLRVGASSQFMATSSQTAVIPGFAAGTQAPLEVRAWQGSSFASASTTIGQQSGRWAFTSKPLGGTPAGGGLPITPPTMTGFGPEDGTGVEMVRTVPEPSTIALGALGVGALLLRRRK